MKQPELLFVDGEYLSVEEPCVSALDRGYTFGDGVFETMRAYRGGIIRLSDHLRRLSVSAAAIRMSLPLSNEAMRLALFTILYRNNLSDAILRISVSRGKDSQRGLLPDPSAVPVVVIRATPFVSFPSSKYLSGFRVIVSSIRRNETSPTSYIKSLNYLDSILARNEAAEADVDDTIRLNTRGHVACGTTSNIFAVTARGLVTPPLSSGVLAGVTRGIILDQAQELGLRVREKVVTLRSLLASREVILTNSVMGLMPVVEIGGQMIGDGKPGPVCARLFEHYKQALERNAEYRQ